MSGERGGIANELVMCNQEQSAPIAMGITNELTNE